jgi:hypothetical protein
MAQEGAKISEEHIHDLDLDPLEVQYYILIPQNNEGM